MNETELDHDREGDRRIREQIDPLIAGLSDLGKIELATRLMGEAIMAPLRRPRRTPPVLEARVVRVIEQPREKEAGEV